MEAWNTVPASTSAASDSHLSTSRGASVGGAGYLLRLRWHTPRQCSFAFHLSERYREVSAPPPEVLVVHLKVLLSGGEHVVSRSKDSKPPRPPATTPESRENQLIAAAVDLAERQIRDGKASSQVITHYLKLGTTREKLEQERIKQENELLKAKVENLASAGRVEELYKNALTAMRAYSGHPESEELDD
jgi:hypothetical protein